MHTSRQDTLTVTTCWNSNKLAKKTGKVMNFCDTGAEPSGSKTANFSITHSPSICYLTKTYLRTHVPEIPRTNPGYYIFQHFINFWYNATLNMSLKSYFNVLPEVRILCQYNHTNEGLYQTGFLTQYAKIRLYASEWFTEAERRLVPSVN